MLAACTTRWLERQTVEVALDVPARDRSGRRLASLWTRDAGMANRTIMREGDAPGLTVPPTVRDAALVRASPRGARDAQRGRWAP